MAWIVTLCFAASLVLWIVLRSRIQDLEWQLAKATESRHSTDLQLSALTARVTRLEKDLAARSSPALQATTVIEEPLPAEPPPTVAPQPAPEETTTTVPIPEPITEPSLFEPSLTEPLPIPPVTGATVIDRGVSRNEEWEALVGGSILNKVGALVLVVGLALFLAYSFTYMGPAGRAAVSALLSASLLAGGIQVERRRKYQTFAYGLIGAGWAGLYATAYAIYALPAARIISDPFWGSLILLATGAAMVLHSLRYKVQTITSIAFFTPFAALAVTPNTPFALISLIPLAAALLYLAWRFEWYRMALFGLAATWGTCISRGSANASLASSQSLLLAYWLLFEAFDLLRIRRKVTGPGLTLLMPLNAIAFIGLSFISWDAHASTDLWFGSALAAMLFLASTFVRLDMGGRYEPSLALAATFGGLAILGRAEGLWASACIAAEAELLFLAGRRFRLPFVRYLGIMAFVVSVSNIGFSPSSRRSFTLLPGVTMNNASPALLLHTFLFYLNRKLWKAGWYFSSAAAVLVCIVLLVETASGYEGLALAAFAVVLFEIARRTALPEFRIQFYFVALTALTTLLISHFSDLHHSAPASAWLSTLGIALASWWVTAQAWRGGGWLKTNERTLVRDISGTIGSALALATFWMVLPDSLVALASLALGIAAVELGLSLQAPSSPLLGCTIACIASIELYATDFSQGKAIWLGNGIPFLAGLYYLWYRLRALAGIIREPVRIILSLMALLLLTVIFYVEFPGRYRTVAWGMEGVALLAAGLGVRERILRLEGLFLLLACILKLFLYDLRNLETIYRILSFIALGVILLGVSWIYTRFRERLRHYL
jgi:uncharacterized membrane protein